MVYVLVFICFLKGWRKNQCGLQSTYSNLEVYTGGLPGHTTPTVVIEENEEMNNRTSTSGRSGPSIAIVPSAFVKLDELL